MESAQFGTYECERAYRVYDESLKTALDGNGY